MDDLMFLGTGLHKSFENKVEKEYRENDKDVIAKDKAEAENACEYLRTFEALSQANADMKIRICNKLKTHYSTIRDDKSFESLESFCNTQSLEAGAAAEAAGGTNNSKGDKAKIDQSKLGAKKQGFFAKAWDTIKRFFIKVFEWIRGKIEQFVGWVKRIFAKDKNASADTIYNDMSDSEINDLESAISKFEFENQSEEGGYIPMTRASGAKFTETTNKYVTICKQFVALMNQCISTGYKPEGMVTYINNLITVLSNNIHGIGNLPKIENANPEQIKKFNRDVKTAAQHLTWNHDPVGYTKFFCGTNFIEAKGKKITCKELYGTDNPKEILRIAEDVTKEFEVAKKNVETAFKAVDKTANDFSNFLKKLNLSSGNITSDNFQMNEQGNNVSDESKADAEKNYEFIATCQTFYNVISKIQNIIGSVAAKALSTTTKATKVIELKNKVKKGIKDFPGNAKDAAGKAYNGAKDAAGKAYNGAKDAYDSAKTGISNFIAEKREADKLKAEAKAKEAEAKAKEAEAKKLENEVAKAEAESRKAEAESRKAELKRVKMEEAAARKAEAEAHKKREKELTELFKKAEKEARKAEADEIKREIAEAKEAAKEAEAKAKEAEAKAKRKLETKRLREESRKAEAETKRQSEYQRNLKSLADEADAKDRERREKEKEDAFKSYRQRNDAEKQQSEYQRNLKSLADEADARDRARREKEKEDAFKSYRQRNGLEFLDMFSL